jgi:hypothetical protein
MAFPVVESSNTSAGTTSASPGASINMPSGIVAGNLLIAFCAGDTAVSYTASGWDEITGQANGTASQLTIFAKIAAGGDSMTLVGEANDYAVVVVRISGHGVSNVTTDIYKGTAATGSSSTPDPPTLSPSPGALDYLWLECFGTDDDDDTATYWSTTTNTFTGIAQHKSATGTSSCMVAVAELDLNASTLNPTTMAMAATEEWIAQTLAIPPDPNVYAAPGNGSLTLTGQAPTVSISDNESGRITWASLSVPVSNAVVVQTPAGSLTLTGAAPTVALTTDTYLYPDAGSLALTGLVPTLAVTAHQWITPDVGSLVLTGQAPSIAAGDNVLATPDFASLTLTGQSPSVVMEEWGRVAWASISVPVLSTTLAQPANASLTITGQTPSLAVTQHVFIEPGAGSLVITGQAPSIGGDVVISPSFGELSLTGQVPSVAATANQVVTPSSASLALTGQAPAVTTGEELGRITWAALSVPVLGPVQITPSVGSITLTGFAPTVAGGVGSVTGSVPQARQPPTRCTCSGQRPPGRPATTSAMTLTAAIPTPTWWTWAMCATTSSRSRRGAGISISAATTAAATATGTLS